YSLHPNYDVLERMSYECAKEIEYAFDYYAYRGNILLG
ncbi:MAG: hypothetical protein K0S61_4831, partial [Anaerocolumna sp.]|nr:hypothetical protein [Anaerocolumna sp.]